MSVKTRRIIAVILITALWMPVVILPVSASAGNTAQIWETPSSTASLIGFVWAKLAVLIPGAAQQENETTAPPGMPALEDAPRQREVPEAPPSNEERKAEVASLKINPENEVTLEAGQQLVVAATPLDSEGNPVHGLGAEWESDQPEVVSITADGLATAKETGQAQLTASAGNKHATLTVTVIAAQPRQGSSAQQSANINTAGLQGSGIQSQGLNRSKEAPATAEAPAGPERSLSHAPRLSRARASLAQGAPVIDEDARRYVSEIGAHRDKPSRERQPPQRPSAARRSPARPTSVSLFR
jgi:hypothetical protein